MSPNSSISNSRGLGYLALAVVAGLAVAVGLAAISVTTLRQGLAQWHFARLFEHQTRKIDALKPAEGQMILLGDSSLGNGVDAAHWQAELGRPVTSLALTGIYGFGGTFNMLRRVLRRTTPETVVLMHSSEILSREVSHNGLLYAAETFGDMREAPLAKAIPALVNLDLPSQALHKLIEGDTPPPEGLVERDYPPQGPRLEKPEEIKPLTPAAFNPEKRYYIQKIHDLCQANGIRCLFTHGPYVDPACSGSHDYHLAINAMVRDVGMEVVEDTPVCFPTKDIGDAPDHVAENLRRHYGGLYLDSLRRHMAQNWKYTKTRSLAGAKK